jgi:hypothetical protein
LASIVQATAGPVVVVLITVVEVEFTLPAVDVAVADEVTELDVEGTVTVSPVIVEVTSVDVSAGAVDDFGQNKKAPITITASTPMMIQNVLVIYIN